MRLSFVVETYALALPEISAGEAESIVEGRIEQAIQKHADFVRFLPAIDFMSRAFFTDHRRMPLDDYLETLYCAVKHGDFSRAWRAELKRPPPTPPPVVN
jgi:hypothetical protein